MIISVIDSSPELSIKNQMISFRVSELHKTLLAAGGSAYRHSGEDLLSCQKLWWNGFA